ncbi:hypothetical protein AMTR_s00083p00179000 [Amborella trichopoda]|uniref:Uncharacterized protein n=1 Tax=Amborella trichopoda TaxID=13333 RepID=W1P6E1_AMBTC|nr:hypothetical protein AMTR_s00083p00179000 [Amborella trichopoda]
MPPSSWMQPQAASSRRKPPPPPTPTPSMALGHSSRVIDVLNNLLAPFYDLPTLTRIFQSRNLNVEDLVVTLSGMLIVLPLAMGFTGIAMHTLWTRTMLMSSSTFAHRLLCQALQTGS